MDSETNESENLPDSQDLELRAKASSSSDASKKAMKITCIRCLKGNGKNPWNYLHALDI